MIRVPYFALDFLMYVWSRSLLCLIFSQVCKKQRMIRFKMENIQPYLLLLHKTR